MIKVNKIEPVLVEHFDNENNSLGFLSELENLDLRCQIAENKVDGYYMMYNGEKISININGELSSFPSGMWDHVNRLFSRLFKIRKSH